MVVIDIILSSTYSIKDTVRILLAKTGRSTARHDDMARSYSSSFVFSGSAGISSVE